MIIYIPILFLFLINIIGLGGGPFLVGFFTDAVFHDERAIRYSLAATVAIGGIGAIFFYSMAANSIKQVANQDNDNNKFMKKTAKQ